MHHVSTDMTDQRLQSAEELAGNTGVDQLSLSDGTLLPPRDNRQIHKLHSTTVMTTTTMTTTNMPDTTTTITTLL